MTLSKNEELRRNYMDAVNNGDKIMAELKTAIEKCVELNKTNEELRREVVEGLKEELRVSRTRHMTNFSKANDCNLQLQAELQTERDEVLRLQHWVQDLQKGMYINCVYCGHRYGPNSEVPASMADVLKEHIEQCPKHPMSKLKQQIADLKRRVAGEQELAEAEAREQARIMK